MWRPHCSNTYLICMVAGCRAVIEMVFEDLSDMNCALICNFKCAKLHQTACCSLLQVVVAHALLGAEVSRWVCLPAAQCA